MFEEAENQAHFRRLRAVSQAGKGIVANQLTGAAPALNVDDEDQAFMPEDFVIGVTDISLDGMLNRTPESLLEREEAERLAMIYLGGAAGESLALEHWYRHDVTKGYRYPQVPLLRTDPRADELQLMFWRQYLYRRVRRLVFPGDSRRLIAVLAERLDDEGQLVPSDVASQIDAILRTSKNSTI